MLCCLFYAHVLLVSNGLELNYPNTIRRTGDFSYTLYVVHFPILVLCLSLALPMIGSSWTLSILAQICAAVLAICVAIVVAPTLENVPFYRAVIREAWIRVVRIRLAKIPDLIGNHMEKTRISFGQNRHRHLPPVTVDSTNWLKSRSNVSRRRIFCQIAAEKQTSKYPTSD